MPVFMFTDIEGCSRLWSAHPDEAPGLLASHDRIVEGSISAHGGEVVKHTGDGVFAVFDGRGGLKAARELIGRVESEDWEPLESLGVRVGLHAGGAVRRGGDYFGAVVNRAAIIMQAASGGQVLLSGEAAEACDLPGGTSLRSLGAHGLRDLGEPLELHELAWGGREFPPPRTLSSGLHNLPAQLTPFVGRSSQLGLLEELLSDESRRLVTITGPGGVGKTRLAMQAAAGQVGRYPGGVFLVRLADTSSSDMVPYAIASALSLELGQGDPESRLVSLLSRRSLLLVLDNLEHLSAAPLLRRLLEGAPDLRLLVTSREVTSLRGETVVRLDPMEEDALELFLECDRRSWPGRSVGAGELELAERICAAVGRLPLAVELAAVLARYMSMESLLEVVRSDPLGLSGRGADYPERQSSLEAVLGYSWDLLEGEERGVLAAAAVFRGGFGLEELSALSAGCAPAVFSLVDKSLLRVTEPGRFDFHPLVREYVLSVSAGEELQRKREAHSRLYLGRLASGSEPSGLDIPNVMLAWERAIASGDSELLASAAEGLERALASGSLFRQGLEAFRGALSLGGDGRYRGIMLTHLGWFRSYLEPAAGAVRDLEEAVSLLSPEGDGRTHALALNHLGNMRYISGDLEGAEELHRRSLEMRRRVRDRWGVGCSLNNLANIAMDRGELERATGLYRQSIEIAEELGDRRGVAQSLMNLGHMADDRGEEERAREIFTESAGISREVGDDFYLGTSLLALAEMAVRGGDRAAATELLYECTELFGGVESRWGLARTDVLRAELSEGSERLRLLAGAAADALRTGLEPLLRYVAERILELVPDEADDGRLGRLHDALDSGEPGLSAALERAVPELLRMAGERSGPNGLPE